MLLFVCGLLHELWLCSGVCLRDSVVFSAQKNALKWLQRVTLQNVVSWKK